MDIKIRQSAQETQIEVTGIEDTNLRLVNGATFDKCVSFKRDGIVLEEAAPSTMPTSDANLSRFRTISSGYISPTLLKRYKTDRRLDEFLHPFDEIDIPTDTGETVTAVCAYVEPSWVRFIFKDCWDNGIMNKKDTNKTGYFKSKGRMHVLIDILPHVAREWQDLFKPRWFVEDINGKRVEYADLMWLPSATDVFGKSKDGYWEDLDDSFQLPIFKKERDRVKECGDKGAYPYWLRSVSSNHTYNFYLVYNSGDEAIADSNILRGFAPGFDI